MQYTKCTHKLSFLKVSDNRFCFFLSLQGLLRIEVLEAKDLIKKDIGIISKGSSDPYVILRGMCQSLWRLLYEPKTWKGPTVFVGSCVP